jgi:hypothetical protein
MEKRLMAGNNGVSTMSGADRVRVVKQLLESLEALAGSSSRDDAVALKLVNDFERSRRFAHEMLAAEVSEMQAHMLTSMQEYIDFMYTLAPDVWNETAIENHACWQQLKEMAGQALETFR